MSFLSFLQEKLGPHNPEDVDQLILDDLFQKIKALNEEQIAGIEKYTSLKHLSLNNIGIVSLKNLPKLPNLQILELRENYITGKELNLIVKQYPNLIKIKLGGNPLKDIDCLDAFAKSDIISIELFGTSIHNIKGYRDIVFHKIKSLESVDNVDREGYHIDSDFFNEDDSDLFDEDGEYVGDSNGEDEFDEDFSAEESDFELSEYGSKDNAEDIKNGKTSGSPKKMMKYSAKKKKIVPINKNKNEKLNYDSEGNASVGSSVNPKITHNNNTNKEAGDLVNGLLGKKSESNKKSRKSKVSSIDGNFGDE